MRMNFDTGSDWLIVETTDCRTCLQNKFDPSQSGSFDRDWSGELTEMEYGSLYALGYEATESVCFTSDESHCAYNFRLFAITYQDGGLFSFEDGIMGLSTYYNDYITGPLLI